MLASDTLQAWLTPLDGNKSQRSRQVKVHKGFHASWRLNGMRDKVTEMIRSEICPTDAAAQRMRVLFTGKLELCLQPNIASDQVYALHGQKGACEIP